MKEDNFEARIHDLKPKSIECKRCERLKKVVEAAKADMKIAMAGPRDQEKIRMEMYFVDLIEALEELKGE